MSRLLTAKQQEAREPKQKRPYLATEVNDVVEADKWRQQILREIGRKVMEIQNAGLGDHRCHITSTHTGGKSIALKHVVCKALCLCIAAAVPLHIREDVVDQAGKHNSDDFNSLSSKFQ